MAERATAKAKRAGQAKTSRGTSAALAQALERLEAKVKTLQSEKDALRKELAASKSRVKQLEEANTQAVNRIDWVIDSLHNLLEDQK